MLINHSESSPRIRSYVIRGRRTNAQEKAYAACWPRVGLSIEQGLINYEAVFGRGGPCFLEIGFGSGVSLLELARIKPNYNLIGIETHQPGIGALCMGIEQLQLSNLKVFHEDAVDVLEKAVPDASLDGVQVFFPDPWPKRRHRERRLVQPDWLKLVVSKLKTGGVLHLATDWQDYAEHMLKVVSQESSLLNLAGSQQFSSRSPQRPVVTKFEMRALKEGRSIWDLQLQKTS